MNLLKLDQPEYMIFPSNLFEILMTDGWLDVSETSFSSKKCNKSIESFQNKDLDGKTYTMEMLDRHEKSSKYTGTLIQQTNALKQRTNALNANLDELDDLCEKLAKACGGLPQES